MKAIHLSKVGMVGVSILAFLLLWIIFTLVKFIPALNEVFTHGG